MNIIHCSFPLWSQNLHLCQGSQFDVKCLLKVNKAYHVDCYSRWNVLYLCVRCMSPRRCSCMKHQNLLVLYTKKEQLAFVCPFARCHRLQIFVCTQNGVSCYVTACFLASIGAVWHSMLFHTRVRHVIHTFYMWITWLSHFATCSFWTYWLLSTRDGLFNRLWICVYQKMQ